MAENPYQDPRFSDFGNEPPEAGPTRTSKLAVASLVLGIVSPLGCIAGAVLAFVGVAAGGAGTTGGLLMPLSIATAVLGLVLGAIALLLVYAKDGLSGAGYAIGGIVINMITLALLIAMIVAGARVGRALVGDAGDLFAALETGDADAARQLMDPSVRGEVTAERVGAFGDEVRDRLGAVSSTPESVFDLFSAGAWQEEGTLEQIESLEDLFERPDLMMMPMPVEFEAGEALVLVFADAQAMDDISLAGDILNLVVIPPQGDPIWLLPPETLDRPRPARETEPIPGERPGELPGEEGPGATEPPTDGQDAPPPPEPGG